MFRPRAADLAAVGLLVLLILACFARLAASPDALIVDADRPSVDYAQRIEPRPIGNDLTFFFLPRFLNDTRWLERLGRLPRWDSNGFAGRPRVGNPQAGLFYPPLWLAWWTRSPSSLGWVTVGHLVWAGLGAYVLARSLGLSAVAALSAAACVEASPYVLAHVFEGHYPHVWSASWYPWAFWSYRDLRSGRWRGALFLPPVLAMSFLAGHPQEWFYLVVALGFWIAADAARLAREGRLRAAFALPASSAGLLAFSLALGAVEMIPDVAARGGTARPATQAAGGSSRYQLHPVHLLQLFGPTALGGPADYIGPDNSWETMLSIGLVPLLLVGIAAMPGPSRRGIRPWLIFTGLALAFAVGGKIGLSAGLARLIPGLGRFRVSARSLFLANLGAAVLVGMGVERLRGAELSAEDRRRWLVLLGRALVGLTLVVLVCHGLAQAFPSLRYVPLRPSPSQPFALSLSKRHPAEGFRAVTAAGNIAGSAVFWLATVGALGVLTYAASRRSSRTAVAWGMSLLAVGELGWHGHALLKVAPADRFLGGDPISRTLEESTPPVPGPFRIRARDTLYTDLRAAAHAVEKVNVYDSFQLAHAADLYETLYLLLYDLPPPDPGEPMAEVASKFLADVRQGVLDRLGVGFLVSTRVEARSRWPLVAWGTWRGQPYAIHRNESAMPRAYVVPRAELAGKDPGKVLAQFARVDPREAVLMRADPLGGRGPRQPFLPAEWLSDDPDCVRIRVTTGAAGLLVIGDTWMPGWTTTVDGHPEPIYRGNHAQRVVALARPGHHEVTLRYRAPGLALGMTVTGAASLAWLSAGVLLWVRGRRRSAIGERLARARRLDRSGSPSRRREAPIPVAAG